MNGRRAVIGLCMLCALAFSAFAAQGAAAASNGTTAFTCVKGKGTLRGEHCLTTGTAAAEYGHVEIAENTTTELTGGNEKTKNETTESAPSILKETIGGVELELKATTVSGTGTMENKKDPVTGEHYAEGSGTIVYSNVEVVKPAGKECEVFTDEEFPVGSGKFIEGAKGTIDAKVKATTKAQGDFVKFEPQGTAFATFWVTCTLKQVPALEGTWEITGSVKCPVNGATILCTHAETTTQNTLFGKGNKAGLEGALTLKGRDPILKEVNYTPLSTTTVATP